MSASRNLKQVRIENSSPAAAPPMSMVGGGSMKGLRGLEPPPENEAAAMAMGKEDEEPGSGAGGGFTVDIKSFLKPGEKSYTQRCRLFVGNLPTDITEEDFKRLFERYGEPSEVFINRDRGFGFIRLVSDGPRLPFSFSALLRELCLVLVCVMGEKAARPASPQHLRSLRTNVSLANACPVLRFRPPWTRGREFPPLHPP